MARVLLIIMALLAAVPARASEASLPCDGADTQAELNACAQEEAVRADDEMHAVYRALLSKAGRKSARTKIRRAHQAWLAFRDAYIEARFPASDKQREYGSIYPSEMNLLKVKLTEQHVASLQDLLSEYTR